MANSSTNIDLIEAGMAQKEVVANALFDAFSPSSQFGRRAAACSGLTWAYYGGVIGVPTGSPPEDVPTAIANGTVTLTASDTNYIYQSSSGTVTNTTSEPSGWPGPLDGNATALYEVITGPTTVSSWTDWRVANVGARGAQGETGSTGASWSVVINAQTGTSYTVQASDAGKVITMSNGSASTLTVPASLGVNFCFEVIQLGTGSVTLTPSSTTLNSYGGYLKLAGQFAGATLIAYSANVFSVVGNLTA